MDDVENVVLSELRKSASPKIAQGQRRYFKEKVEFYGVPVPACRRIAAGIWKVERSSSAEDPRRGAGEILSREGIGSSEGKKRKMTAAEIFPLTEKLLGGKWEAGTVGLDLLYRTRKEWDEGTLRIFSGWLDGSITNWAHCDELSNHSIGYLAEKYPKEAGWELLSWTASPNRWKRRAAAVSLVIPAKRGEMANLVFAIAERLLGDEDEMVQKGVGWVLKELARKKEMEVISFLRFKKTSRLVLRIASEKMTKKGAESLLG